MKNAFKIFTFMEIPVYLKYWFFILLIWVSPIYLLSIFISLLLHEMCHAYMAKNLGYNVTSIELNFFAGFANMNIDEIRDKDMIKIAAAGPWANFTLMALFLFITGLGFSNQFTYSMIVINFLFAAFNLIPIFPLDGGRILRSSLVLKTGNVSKSIRISSFISLIFSILLLAFYIYSFSLIGIFFAILFILFSLKELGYINIPL